MSTSATTVTARDPRTLTAQELDAITALVEEIRFEEGHGGQCGFVCEVLARDFGWDMLGGVYFTPDGIPIGDHVWCYDPVSELRVDPTADQFGEGAEIRVFAEDDAVGLRYRHAESEEEETSWLDQARATRDALGDYWWVAGGRGSAAVREYEAKVDAYTSTWA